MRTIPSMRQNSLKLGLRAHLIGPLVLLIAAAAIFASPDKKRITSLPRPPMPGLRGGAAIEYLKHQGLYNSLGVAVMAARYAPSNRITNDPIFAEVKKLTASGGVSLDNFGFSVAIYADTAIVGAPFSGIGSIASQGTAYIFQRNRDGTDQWGQVKKLTASDGGMIDNFGVSVAIYKDTAIVGAASHKVGSNSSQGSAYIFERNQGGANNWGEVKELTASDGAQGDGFGRSAAIYGDTAIIAAPLDDVGSIVDQGSAYVFERNQGGANNWGEVEKLTASDGAQGDSFGLSTAVYGDTAIIGAFRDDIGSVTDQGSAYIFERNQGGANNWGEVRKLIAPDGVASNWFGFSVAIYADTAIVGTAFDLFNAPTTSGAAYVFERNQGGSDQWGQVKKLTASDGAIGDGFGISTAIYGNTVVVGKPFDFLSSGLPGASYLFERNQGGANNWGEVKELVASDVNSFDEFGVSASIYANTIIIGADGFDSGRGAAYIIVGGNTPPTISMEPITIVEGAPATNSIIAAVSSPTQAAGALAVTVNGSASANSGGVTVSNITVDAAGEVRADVVAACGASNAVFTLRVTDGGGLFAEDPLDVTVTPENVAPSITLKPSISLWPPDHEYHVIAVVQMVESVSDNCSTLGIGDVVVEKVTSDEPDNSLDDGNTTNDIVIAPDCRSVQLRAERSGTSDGRIYAITLRLTDSRGNVTRRDFEVSVPIGQDGVPAVKGATALTVAGGCQ
ncbi:MAG: FG-GAP repeat protein [Chloracidobacterium sp.]|nr:FG-GAP repeat protein [Chloracidobacterium sp.]